jgi:hypothetical protein
MVHALYDDYGSDVFYDTRKSHNALDDALDEYVNNLFDGMNEFDLLTAADDFEGTDFDSLSGEPTGLNTTDIESRIAEHMRRQRARQPVHMHAIFPVGRRPRQGIQRGDIQIPGTGVRAAFPDVSFVGRDNVRVNLEVDNAPPSSICHQTAHLRAMNATVQNIRTPGRWRGGPMAPQEVVDQTRSVFVVIDNQGRVCEIRYVRYILRGGIVFRDETRSYICTYSAPIGIGTILQFGILEGDGSPSSRRGGSYAGQCRRGISSTARPCSGRRASVVRGCP